MNAISPYITCPDPGKLIQVQNWDIIPDHTLSCDIRSPLIQPVSMSSSLLSNFASLDCVVCRQNPQFPVYVYTVYVSQNNRPNTFLTKQ